VEREQNQYFSMEEAFDFVVAVVEVEQIILI
jgi:hypothetical protein